MKIDIRFDENMNRPKYFVTKKKPNKKTETYEIRTEDTKQLDFVIISYDYSIENLQNENFSIDLNSFVNCVYVVGANVNGHTCTAIKKNEDPTSPISVGRIGLRVADVINDSNITTDQLAEERAEYELRKKIIAESTLSSSVMFNPLLSVNNIVTYTDEEDFDMKRERFLIQSISFNLGYDGLMSLSVSNINNLPFVY